MNPFQPGTLDWTAKEAWRGRKQDFTSWVGLRSKGRKKDRFLSALAVLCLVHFGAGQKSLLVAAAQEQVSGAPGVIVQQAALQGQVPGVAIDYSPASSGLYIGSPSIAVLSPGVYLASHDLFGPKSVEHECPTTVVLRSSDSGLHWDRVARLPCLFWPKLFVHRNAAYLMGTDKHHGRIVIRRSIDRGETWTEPKDGKTGLLTPEGQYHTAPVPVLEHDGRLWRAFEDAMGGTQWGQRYRAMMMSAPVESDLLHADNWTFSEVLARDPAWLDGQFNGWLEGNAVLTRDGHMVNILRVDTPTCPEKAAIVHVSDDGKSARFDPATGFIDFPGGAKKFTIRFDPQSDLYWSLATMVPERHQQAGKPGGIRNTLALTCSKDLRHWEVRSILLYHPDIAKHGFQYPDWQFEGDDIIAAVRTAYDDGAGGARNNHDANFLTFHRITNFRSRTMADSVPMPEVEQARHELDQCVIRGAGFELATLEENGKAFSNRTYVWKNVPERFVGSRYTRSAGGERPSISVLAKQDMTVYLATAFTLSNVALPGWAVVEGATFYYTDRGQTKMQVHARELKAGQQVELPQGNWTGGLLLIAP